MDEKCYKVVEVARRLRVSTRLLYNLIQAGRLEHFKVGHAIRIPERAVAALIKSPVA